MCKNLQEKSFVFKDHNLIISFSLPSHFQSSKMSPDSFKHIRLSPDPVESILDLIHFITVIPRPCVDCSKHQDWNDDHQKNLSARTPEAAWLVQGVRHICQVRLLWHLRKNNVIFAVGHFYFSGEILSLCD